MDFYYDRVTLSPDNYPGQFILTKNRDFIPQGWSQVNVGQWYLGVLGLPVLDVETTSEHRIGWCVGYPITGEQKSECIITLRSLERNRIDMLAIENFYEHTGGKYILILLTRDEQSLFLDPYGSLAAVFSTTEPVIASTPTLLPEHEWNEELIKALKMPKSGLWFPSGLTPKKGVRRLLPNHCLNLDNWSVHRHWPTSKADVTVEHDEDAAERNVDTIASSIKSSIGIVAAHYPLQLSLTAGRDSRMLLACTRDALQCASFFTFAEKNETVDTHIALRLATRFNLNHVFIPVQDASEAEMRHWLYLTGHSVSGAIWKMHKSLQGLDRNRVLLPGMGGEVGRSFYWRQSDEEDTVLSPKDLLERCGLPQDGEILLETSSWLSELSSFNALSILDLFYIEQRLGCWAAPQHYGNIVSLFEFSPFNHRKIFRSMMKLPYEYRRRQELAQDICLDSWSDLLMLPFNEFTGIKKYTGGIRNLAYRTLSPSYRVIKKALSSWQGK